ncbi:hypothetical protein PSENEW3_00006186 [Picochlorum sp. SENEW3]|nr:hypothetical protein PSENEW3_00006186 [Picochlorum sp. SENEW3]
MSRDEYLGQSTASFQGTQSMDSRRSSSLTNARHEALMKWSNEVVKFLNNLTSEQPDGLHGPRQKAAMPHSAFAKPTALAFLFKRKWGCLVSIENETGFITRKIVDEEGNISWSAPYFTKGRGVGIGFSFGRLSSGICLALMNEEALDYALGKKGKFGANLQFLIDMDGAYIRSVSLDSTSQVDNVINIDSKGGLMAKYFRMQAMMVDFSIEFIRTYPDAYLNDKVYSDACGEREILSGTLMPPFEFSGVIDLLNRLAASGGRAKPKKTKSVKSPFG